jgi:hypothetical protein
MARTDPKEALDQIRDWANIARRNDRPETVVAAARAVMAETAVEMGAYDGDTRRSKAQTQGS